MSDNLLREKLAAAAVHPEAFDLASLLGEAISRIRELRSQRDALLQAAKRAHAYFVPGDFSDPVRNQLGSAIAISEAEKGES